jgi:hypothetical protein
MDAAAFIARKLGATFAFIDCRGMQEEAQLNLEEEEEEEEAAFMRLTAEALGESLAASFRLWEGSYPGSELLMDAVELAMTEVVTPEATPITLTAYTKARLEDNAQRDRGMSRTIIDLCSGKLTGAPRKLVLVIVGRNHVAPLIELLKAA